MRANGSYVTFFVCVFPALKCCFTPANLHPQHREIPDQIRTLIDAMKSDTVSVFYTTAQPSKHRFIIFFPPNVTKRHISLALILSDAGFRQGLEAGDPFHRRQ